MLHLGCVQLLETGRFFTGPAIWNSLPVDLRSISDNANLKIKQLIFNIHSYFIY